MFFGALKTLGVCGRGRRGLQLASVSSLQPGVGMAQTSCSYASVTCRAGMIVPRHGCNFPSVGWPAPTSMVSTQLQESERVVVRHSPRLAADALTVQYISAQGLRPGSGNGIGKGQRPGMFRPARVKYAGPSALVGHRRRTQASRPGLLFAGPSALWIRLHGPPVAFVTPPVPLTQKLPNVRLDA